MLDLNRDLKLVKGYNPCKICRERTELTVKSENAFTRVNELVKKVSAELGKYAGDLWNSKQQLLRDISNYCTQSHVEACLCTAVGKKPDLALNASIMFTSDGVGSEYDLVRTLLSIP